MAKSSKPIVWSLFAGGGMLAAFLMPAMIFITGIAVPMELLPEDGLAYDRMLAFARNPIGKLVLFSIIFLSLWQAAHRLRMTLHDLGLRSGRVAMLACYGMAGLGSIAAAAVLLSI
jgi:fumarate reductase subunit D